MASTMGSRHDMVRHIGDAAAFMAALAAWVAPVAGLLTIIWTGMRIHEMVTGRPFHEGRCAKWVMNLWSRPRS